MTDMMFDMKVAQLLKIQKKEKEMKREKDRLKKEIQDEMTARKVSKIGTKKFEASWIWYSTHRFDSTTFKEKMPELYDKFTVESNQDKFTYKSVG